MTPAADEAPQPQGSTTPVESELDRAGRRLRFVWADGRHSDYDWEYLRWHCPCAICSGEGGREGTLASKLILLADETQMADVELVGRYAVRPTWQAGHDVG